ncbi:hypothetical protein CKY28_12940 [Sphingomonas lenta]|uniref:Uncharacterized protein n=1 Tax=Sphingomonas lenta TaxID=1141887 RepID=A0A2A2SCI5_9SPHN|nr:hypothetical protein CKY28_12940 [Sphingomonas lenta]
MTDGARAWRILEAAAGRAAARGAMLFRLDLATELARAALTPGELGEAAPIAMLDGEGYAVACVEDAFPLRVRALVRFRDGRAAVFPDAAEAPPALEALAHGRRTVERAALVGRGLAQTVLMMPLAGVLEAYAIRRAEREGDLVLGVHWLVRLSGDGRALMGCEPLSRSAATVPAEGGRLPERIAVSHFGATPNEAHHYLSLKHGVALDVLALESETWWRVEGERSEPVRA